MCGEGDPGFGQCTMAFGFGIQVDEVGRSRKPEQVRMPQAPVQKDIHIVYPEAEGHVFCVGRGVPEIHHGCDLESGGVVSEPEGSSFMASARRLVGKVGCRLDLSQRVSGSGVGGHIGKNGVQCGVASCACCQKKGQEAGFWDHQGNAAKGSDVSVFKKQSQDVGLAKTGSGVCVCGEKTRHGNCNNSAVKPGWKKPPRPPRAATNSMKERDMISFSDIALVRRARLERIRSRKQKCMKPSSNKSTVWAMLFTISFCVIMIVQGICSQGSASPPESSAKTGQRSSLLQDNLAIDASNSQSGHRAALGKILAPLSSSRLRKYYFSSATRLDEAN